jgi:GNAT superfamily N-acetyltransferase
LGLVADPGSKEDRMRQLFPSPPSRELHDRPDLDQLRHQARDLLRAAAQGDAEACARIGAVSPRVTLSAAQLAVAREHGFPSWARLRLEVERRKREDAERAAVATATASPVGLVAAPRFVIRQVESLEELAATFDIVGAQFVPAITHDDRRFQDLAHRFPEDRALMLMVEEMDAQHQPGAERIVGGALAFGGRGLTLRAIGLELGVRRQGLGRRLMERIELEAIRRGAGGISLGASDDSKGFYARLGYAGRGTMMHKGLPLPGRFLEARLRKLAAAAEEESLAGTRPGQTARGARADAVQAPERDGSRPP